MFTSTPPLSAVCEMQDSYTDPPSASWEWLNVHSLDSKLEGAMSERLLGRSLQSRTFSGLRQRDIQAFLGMSGYYRRFVPNYATFLPPFLPSYIFHSFYLPFLLTSSLAILLSTILTNIFSCYPPIYHKEQQPLLVHW